MVIDARFTVCHLREEASAHANDRVMSAQWQRLMHARVPDLAALVSESLRESEPGYRSGAVPLAELPVWVSRSVFRVLDGFAMPDADLLPTLDVAAEVGARRARQGLPPRALQRAYHLVGEALSASLAQWTATEDIDAQESTMLANKLWRVVSEHSLAGVDALCRAYEGYTDQRSAGYLLDALLNGDDRPVTVTSVARAFVLSEDERYSVIVRHPTSADPSVPAEELASHMRGMRVIWRQHGESAVGVVALGGESPCRLRDCLPDQDSHRMGVSTAISGLGGLGRARSLAETAARTLRGSGLAFLEDRLDVAIVSSRPDLARELQIHVLAPLLDLEEWRREVLLKTLEAWLDTDGSTARAALRLYCHRNTVINRLRRIEELTHRSLSVPKDLISLTLALRAYRQLTS
jgi:hypothetical protein